MQRLKVGRVFYEYRFNIGSTTPCTFKAAFKLFGSPAQDIERMSAWGCKHEKCHDK